ncbi:hypothetical protein ACFL6U_09980 [Planctomycetota bacterium]
MRNKTNTKLFIGSILTLALALAIWSPALAQSLEPTKGKAIMPGDVPACCVEMKAKCQTMWDDLKAEDAALTKQVAKMNIATGDKKMTLMATLITTMVEQRTATNTRTAKMQQDMMQHMMQCPMMMGMKDMPKKPVVARSEHPDHPK